MRAKLADGDLARKTDIHVGARLAMPLMIIAGIVQEVAFRAEAEW